MPVIKETTAPANVHTFAEIKMPVANEVALTISINSTSVQIHNHTNEDAVAAQLRIIKAL